MVDFYARATERKLGNSTMVSYLAFRREIRRRINFSRHSVACVGRIEIESTLTKVRVGQYTATVTWDGRHELERTTPIRVPSILQILRSNKRSAMCDFCVHIEVREVAFLTL